MDGSIVSLILDLMVILITVGFIWYGVRRGFLVMLVNTCGRLLSCIVAYIASRALATTIYNVYIHDRLVESISESISGTLSESEASVQVSVILQELPGFLRNMVYGLFGDAATINETVGNALDGSVTAITSTIVDEIVYPIVSQRDASQSAPLHPDRRAGYAGGCGPRRSRRGAHGFCCGGYYPASDLLQRRTDSIPRRRRNPVDPSVPGLL